MQANGPRPAKYSFPSTHNLTVVIIIIFCIPCQRQPKIFSILKVGNFRIRMSQGYDGRCFPKGKEQFALCLFLVNNIKNFFLSLFLKSEEKYNLFYFSWLIVKGVREYCLLTVSFAPLLQIYATSINMNDDKNKRSILFYM